MFIGPLLGAASGVVVAWFGIIIIDMVRHCLKRKKAKRLLKGVYPHFMGNYFNSVVDTYNEEKRFRKKLIGELEKRE